jgi:hypothetical protein
MRRSHAKMDSVVLLILTISCKPAVNNVNSYAEDRAAIEDGIT